MEGVHRAENGEVAAGRRSASYHPTVWGDYFIVNEHHLSSLKSQMQEKDREIKERVEELREKVKKLFEDASGNVLQTMELVDSIQLLGLDYHFEKEIDEAIVQIYHADIDTFGLYEDSLRFRLLREHGYHVSSNIFNKFKDERGDFNAALNDDAKGSLSLYNAAFVGTKEDIILDEVIPFARCQLTSLMEGDSIQKSLAMQISLALETPLYKRMRRLLARKYIAIYEEDEKQNITILQLAKLDFNLVQSLHREELHTISSWWRDLDIINSLTYARDRVVECYYWICSVLSTPEYSRARVIASKIISLASVLDDTYDNYSTIEESRLLTEAIERWEHEAVDTVPPYLKNYYLKLLNTVEGFKNELKHEEKYRVRYLIDQYKILSRNYFEEANWGAEKNVPSVEEYMRVATLTTAFLMLTCACFVGMGDMVTKEAFDWVASFPNIIKDSTYICRMQDDINSHELEQQRDHVASSVQCYMKEHGVDENEACEKLRGLIDDAWKDQTKECFRPTPVPRVLLEVVVNFSRTIEDIHKYIDSYTHSDGTLKDQISKLFVEPIPI